MTDPTLPSRERVAEIAPFYTRRFAEYDPKWGPNPAADLRKAGAEPEVAAILAAYASGALVTAGEVTAMRERAAAICDDEAGEKPSPYYETSRAQEALEAAAARIRALPLEVPHDQ